MSGVCNLCCKCGEYTGEDQNGASVTSLVCAVGLGEREISYTVCRHSVKDIIVTQDTLLH